VRVNLHTTLRRRTAQGLLGRLDPELPEGSTVADLLRALAIAPKGLLLVVNGRTAGLERVLEEGDEVDLIPALSGG
jgi:sulfur carrier protein ThiS